MKKMKSHKRIYRIVGMFLIMSFFFSGRVLAAGDIVNVLVENRDIFHCNNIISTFLRWLGWGIIKALSSFAGICAELFDNSFLLIDFTEWGPVQEYIEMWRPVFVALVCLSLVFMGILLIFNHDKKPKVMVNICLAVLIVSASTYLISTMNNFLATDIRNAVITGDDDLDTRDTISDMVGSSFYDLLYMDEKIDGGLMNVTKENRVVYDSFTETDMDLIDINEIIKEDDVRAESQELVTRRIFYKKDNVDVKEIYNGVAWTDLLNEYYYRYSVEWVVCIVGLISLILVYLFLAYKVVRILYEIVIHQLLAVLYSANLTNNQKVLKVLEAVKDSYITLVLVMACMKVYLLAYKFLNTLDLGQISRCFLLLFIAFAVVDGPNIIQKLTGVDAGLSSGAGKLIAGMQMMRMASMHLPRGGFSSSQSNSRISENMVSEGDMNPTAHSSSRDGLANDTGMDGEKGIPPEQNHQDQHNENNIQGNDNEESQSANNPEMGGRYEENSVESAEPADLHQEGSGYEDVAESAGDSTIPQYNNSLAADLNGMDPETGEINKGSESMKRMEDNKDLEGQQYSIGSEASKRKSEVIQDSGTIFRTERMDSLQKESGNTNHEIRK